MKFNNTEVWGFEHAFRGLRNPKNSWNRSDSKFNDYYDEERADVDFDELLKVYPNAYIHHCNINGYYADIIGEADLKLAQTLIKAGNEHRKFMRQIFVSVDITAPLYWWKEFDTYKVGTVANSTSTMHKITSQPITLDCFEIDDYEKDLKCLETYDSNIEVDYSTVDFEVYKFINFLENLRQKYLETKDKRYWKELIRWLPESWLQKRTVTMTYENLLAMCSKGQRRFHKLNEWSGQDNSNVPNLISWARTLPYAQEFIFIDENELETK